MSASDIPDLRTLLGNRRGGATRSRDRGRGPPGAPSETVRENAVRGTDQDAAGSRVSCVELGYLYDPYARCFATQPSTRRLPLLNRGMYSVKSCHRITLPYANGTRQEPMSVPLQSTCWWISSWKPLQSPQNR